MIKSRNCTKTTIYFLGLMLTLLNDFVVFLIKPKSRCKRSTDAINYNICSQLGQKHALIEFNNLIFPRIVTLAHDLVQHMHHTNVYELEHYLLLISNKSGNAIYVVWIKRNNFAKSAHKRILDTACKYGLKWVHEHADGHPNNLEQLVKATVNSYIDGINMEVILHF